MPKRKVDSDKKSSEKDDNHYVKTGRKDLKVNEKKKSAKKKLNFRIEDQNNNATKKDTRLNESFGMETRSRHLQNSNGHVGK